MKNFMCILGITASIAVSCQPAPQKQAEVSTKNTNAQMINEEIEYVHGQKNYKSFVAYENDGQPKPVVFVIPEWWGMSDYVKTRARMLADLGYFAMAVDFYGNAENSFTPEGAQKLATPFYNDVNLGKAAFDAARKEVKKFKEADTSQEAVIGYCFGGGQALNMGRLEGDLKGVVSFHGSLKSEAKPNNNKVRFLVLNGADDTFVSQGEIANFKKQMDSAQIQYRFVNYPGAVHAFTNPEATELGKKFDMNIAYNQEADKQSWEAMKAFFNEIFK